MSTHEGDIPAALTPGGGRNTSFAPARTIMALILREMSTRYGKSPGGYIWAVIEPLGAIMILAIGFSLLLRTPSLGTSFLLFYATGYLPFNLYQTLALQVSNGIAFSKPLLYYPVVSWVDAILARFILNSLTAVLISYILIAGIRAAIDIRTVIDMGPILWAMGLGMLMGLGVGTLNCVIKGLFPVYEAFWGILTRPMFIASGVLFIYEDLPAAAQDILWYNPIFHITGLMRAGIYPTYSASYASKLYVASIGLTVLTLGLVLLRRYHRDLMER